MSELATYTKDPSEVLDYGIDWAALLTGGEVIDVSSWRITPASGTADDLVFVDSEGGADGTHTTTTTTAWVEGGRAWRTYELTNAIETDGGRTYERSVRIKVRDR